MDIDFKKKSIDNFLIPSDEILKFAIDFGLKNKVADLVIQESYGLAIIMPTKETKTLVDLNNKIYDKQSFVLKALKDIIKDTERFSNFMSNYGNTEENIGLNYTYTYSEKLEDGTIKEVEKVVRLRCTCIKELRGYQINIRLGNINILDYKKLNIPENFRELLNQDSGLILITGPTGSGKTTVINSLLNDLIKKRNIHLLTLEDPIEYIYNQDDIIGLVTYREKGTNFKNYAEGVENSLRLSPKVIMIGEIRNAETANAVIEAVLGGHLIISTLHTDSVIGTIQKMVKWAQASKNEENINVFADFLRGIFVQKLIKTKDENWKSKIVAIREILYGDKKISKLIKADGKPDYGAIKNKMLEKSSYSITMNEYLINLYKNKEINSVKEIFDNTNDVDGLIEIIKEDTIKYKEIFKNEIDILENEINKVSFK